MRIAVRWRMAAVAVLVAGAVLYALLSLVNHWCFRTFGLDLGLYTHALYDYAHLRAADCAFFLDRSRNLLSDHFDLYLVLLSPLVYLGGSWTLLIVQLLAVMAGAAGVYCLVACSARQPWLPVAAMVSFLAFFGVWHAVAFDYHSNVVAAMLVPWLMVALHKRRYGWFAAGVVLVCVAKESMPLWMLFVLMALAVEYRHDKIVLRWLAAAALFCLTYLLIVTLWLMPALCPDPSPGFWRYAYMGDGFGAIGRWVVTHPIEALRRLVVDPSGQKVEFYVCLLLSGGVLCFFRPQWLLPLVPLVAQKMLSADEAFWGIGYQYNVECAVVVVPAAFITISNMKHPRLQRALALLLPLLVLATTVYTCHHPRTWVRTENVRVFSAAHYRCDTFDRRQALQTINAVPEGASVSAASCLTPRLALRRQVYCHPAGRQADYTLLVEEGAVVLRRQSPNVAP